MSTTTRPARRSGSAGSSGASATIWIGLACLLLAIAIVFLPLGAAAVAVLPLAVLVLFQHPKALCAITILVMVVAGTVESRVAASLPVDEGMIVLALVAVGLRRLLDGKALRGFPGLGWFVGFLALGYLSALVNTVPLAVSLPAGFIAIKAVLVGLVFAQVDWTPADVRRGIRLGVWLAVVVAIACAINLAIPGPWTRIFREDGYSDTNFGIPSPVGIFVHPAALSRFAAVVIIGALAHRYVFGKSRGSTVLIGVYALITLAAFRTKTLGSVLIAGVLISWRRMATIAGLGVVAAAVVVLIFGDQLAAAFSEQLSLVVTGPSARTSLHQGMVTVANEHWPLGAGYGRYGSSVAANEYSPEYSALGFPSIYGLGPGEDGRFLTDTQWPAIVGEAGWIGGLMFVAGLVTMVRRLATTKPADAAFRWIRLAGLGWLAILVVESVAAPVFTSPPSYGFAFLALGVLASAAPASEVDPEEDQAAATDDEPEGDPEDDSESASDVEEQDGAADESESGTEEEPAEDEPERAPVPVLAEDPMPGRRPAWRATAEKVAHAAAAAASRVGSGSPTGDDEPPHGRTGWGKRAKRP